MKLLLILIAILGSQITYAIPQEVDLDKPFLKATVQSGNSLIINEIPRGWDGAGNLPPIVRQSPFGACQSFSMAAMMEYLFFRETGKVLKLSEKQVAYNLLQLMIGEHWNKEKNKYELKPSLGHGIAPYMIETLARNGLMPNADYPWGDFESADGSRSIDTSLFDRIFEKPEQDYLPAEYSRYLGEVFLSPPPKSIRYTYKEFNFQSGKEEEILLRSPLELSQAISWDKNKFTVFHNKEMNPTYHPQNPSELKETLHWFESEADHFSIKYETTTGNNIITAIMNSLNERMVVLIAADVWFGSWKDKLVYAGGGGHGLVIVGYQYRENELYFKLRNSWGKEIGIDGYNYIKASILLPNLFYAVVYK